MTRFILGFVLWAVLHSLTAAQWLKNWVRAGIGERYFQAFYRLGYNLVSFGTLIPVFLLYLALPDVPLWSVPAPWRWLMNAVQLAGLAGLTVSLLQTRALAFAGIQQVLDFLAGREDPDPAGLGETLVVGGIYRYIRHPLYSFSMLLLWFAPDFSRNYLVLVVLISAYFLIGSIFEERRLLADFGPDYAVYQRQVPRFIPRFGR